MALTATSTEEATATTDIVAIRRADTGEQVFAAARPMTASVYEVAKAMEHPLEDGATIIDHLVFQPVEIEMPLMVTGETAADVYDEIRQLFRAGILLSVQAKARTYDSMLIVAVPHDERPEEFDALTISLQLREAVFVASTYGGATVVAPAPARPGAPATRAPAARVATTRRGAQQTTPAPPVAESRSSILFRQFGRPQ